MAAGAHRSFALEDWGHLRPEVWEDARERAAAEGIEPDIVHRGSDIAAEAIAAALENARRARVADQTHFEVAPVRDARPSTDKGLLIANPPYGVRLERNTVYEDLLETYRTHFAGWALAFLAPRDFKPPAVGLDAQPVTTFRNGGIPVTWWKFTHRA